MLVVAVVAGIKIEESHEPVMREEGEFLKSLNLQIYLKSLCIAVRVSINLKVHDLFF